MGAISQRTAFKRNSPNPEYFLNLMSIFPHLRSALPNWSASANFTSLYLPPEHIFSVFVLDAFNRDNTVNTYRQVYTSCKVNLVIWMIRLPMHFSLEDRVIVWGWIYGHSFLQVELKFELRFITCCFEQHHIALEWNVVFPVLLCGRQVL